MNVEPGIYYDIPFDDYAQWDAVNNSKLKILAQKTPMHARYVMEEERESSEALITGNAYHTLVLEPDKFDSRFAIIPECDRRTKEGKDIYAQFLAGKGDKQELTAEQHKMAMAMAESIRRSPIYNYFRAGRAEVCIVWDDKRTGLRCKARIDYLREQQGFMGDLKSALSAAPDDFAMAAIKYGYYQQAAFYCDGYTAVKGNPASFVFVAQEKTAPYLAAAYEVFGPEMIVGQKIYRRALDTYAECLKTNNWYGYEPIQKLVAPQWFLTKQGYSELEMGNG